MAINEFIFVLDYVRKTVPEKKLLELTQQLQLQLEQARSNPTPQTTKAIVELRESLSRAHEEAEPKQWNHMRRSLFDRFGGTGLIGAGARKEIDRVFSHHSADPYGAAQSLRQFREKLSLLAQRAERLLDSLGPMAEMPEADKPGENEGVLRLIFAGEASIKTIEDLRDAAKSWNQTLSAFSRLAQRGLGEVMRVRSISPGSLVIELIGADSALAALAKGTGEVLSAYERYLQIQTVQFEIRALGLKADHVSGLDQEAKALVEGTAEAAAGKLLKDYGWEKDAEAKEMREGLCATLREVFSFVKNGGRVDYLPQESSKDKPAAEKLADTFAVVRKLELKVEEFKALVKDRAAR